MASKKAQAAANKSAATQNLQVPQAEPAPTPTILEWLVPIADATFSAGPGFGWAPLEVIQALPPDSIQFDPNQRNSKNEVAVRVTQVGADIAAKITAEKTQQAAPAPTSDAAPSFGGNVNATPTGWATAPHNNDTPQVQGAIMAGMTQPFANPVPTLATQDAQIAQRKMPAASNFHVMGISLSEIPNAQSFGRGYTYPFESLTTDPTANAFFIPATEDNPEPKKRISSSVNGANAKYKKAEGENSRYFVVRSYTHPQHGDGALVVRTR